MEDPSKQQAERWKILSVREADDDDPFSGPVDKDEAVASLQALLALVPQHAIGQAIDLFTTVHEFIVLAPKPLTLLGRLDQRSEPESKKGIMQATEDDPGARQAWDSPEGFPLEDPIERARRQV